MGLLYEPVVGSCELGQKPSGIRQESDPLPASQERLRLMQLFCQQGQLRVTS